MVYIMYVLVGGQGTCGLFLTGVTILCMFIYMYAIATKFYIKIGRNTTYLHVIIPTTLVCGYIYVLAKILRDVITN